jgi:hypothetical protein
MSSAAPQGVGPCSLTARRVPERATAAATANSAEGLSGRGAVASTRMRTMTPLYPV